VLRHEVQQPHRHLHRVCDHRIAEHEWLSTCANRCVRLRLHDRPADVMLTACPVPRVWGATSRAWVADQR